MPELSDFEKEVTPTLGFRKLRLHVKEIPEYYLFNMVSLTEAQVQALLTLPNTSPQDDLPTLTLPGPMPGSLLFAPKSD